MSFAKVDTVASQGCKWISVRNFCTFWSICMKFGGDLHVTPFYNFVVSWIPAQWKAYFPLRALMKFRPHFVHVSSSLDTIRYTRCTQKFIMKWTVACKFAQWYTLMLITFCFCLAGEYWLHAELVAGEYRAVLRGGYAERWLQVYLSFDMPVFALFLTYLRFLFAVFESLSIVLWRCRRP